MRIGFRKPPVVLVWYLRRDWSLEVWLGRFGLFWSRIDGFLVSRTGEINLRRYVLENLD